MRRPLRDLPLRRKLLLALWLASSAALLLASLLTLAYELATFQPRLARELGVKAELLSLNLHAALSFNDAEVARETLSTLQALPEVGGACVFTKQGQLFARYSPRPDATCNWHAELTHTPLHFTEHQLWFTRPILSGPVLVGYLQIQYDLPSLGSRLAEYAVVLALVLLAVGLLSLLLAGLLRRLISDPLMELGALARTVSASDDYSRRAAVDRRDEIGWLAEALNHMLDKIGQRDAELRASHATLQAVIDNTTAVIYVKDLDGRFILVNRQFETLFHTNRQGVLGRTDRDLFPAQFAEEYRRNDQEVMQSREPLQFEETALQEDGEHTYLSVKFPLTTADGQVSGICGVSTDITERKRDEAKQARYRDELEAAVRARTRELESANTELKAFSYSVSHDLRAPLRTLDGFSLMLAEDYADRLDDRGRDYINRLRRAAQRMSDLIDAMLLLSKVANAGLKRELVDLSAIASSISDDLRNESPQRPIEFEIAPDVKALADRQLIQIVLRNLLENAWKYSAYSEPSRITFGVIDDGERIYFIRDNGAGFDMAYSNKLFQPFQRLHKAEEFSGTGIGLATVQRVIQRHNGRIWADSQPGCGSTFFFTLENFEETSS
ncbi:PAS domain-containing protein [Chitinimonas lacunae]|uniref:histidine kinase n=1 Tax=Chitinimonas lacunae TaxID=1963018 RepID=A0ABV8MWC6_9NEIS